MVFRRKIWVWLTGIVALVLLFWKFLSSDHELSDSSFSQHDYHSLEQHTRQQLQECRVQAGPWFVAGKKYKQVLLVFYHKPIMQALLHICVEKDWKIILILEDDEVGTRELKRVSSEQHTFTIVYTTSRAFRHPVVKHLANSTNALVSAVRYAFYLAGGKKAQLVAFRSFFNRHGCDLRDMEIMPRSFLLDDSKECTQFFKYARLNSQSWWILKPSSGYGGEGITVHKNMSHLYDSYATCRIKEQLIVQEYIANLLLVEGRKFDVRAFVLIAGTNPYIMFYHEGYLRLSMERFDAKEGGNSVHLTNSHIQIQSRNFSVDKHYWSFQRFQGYLDDRHPTNGKFVSENLVPFIKKVGLFILQTGIM